MIKHIILFSVILTLAIIASDQEAFAQLDCKTSNCHAMLQSSRSTPVEGLEFRLDSPDLYVDRHACENTAVSAGWLIANPLPGNNNRGEWIEAGVTRGHFENFGCITKLSAYYAINYYFGGEPVYQEHLVPNGRMDPGDDITVRLQKHETTQAQVYVTTPDYSSRFATAQVTMNPRNVYNADFGIEGTISATDEYSSIPMSKFTNMKVRQGSSWIDLPRTAALDTPDSDEGYIGKRCSKTSFVAGTVTQLDCNVIATRNQIPAPAAITLNPVSQAPITIPLDAVDTDYDYLRYNLVEIPTKGFLNYNNLGQHIPNTDGDSAQLIYTPARLPIESDTIRYTVTDGRLGHTREGMISIVGSVTSTMPDPVDDFAYTLSGVTINFTWSHPDDGGSEITSYEVERSRDGITWSHHNTYSETVTGFEYQRHEGYSEFFRIFANNEHGASASSNVLHVYIPDTSPPDVTIQSPGDGSTITTSFVDVEGNIFESRSTGIENITVWVDNIPSNDPVIPDVISEDTNVNFESTLTGLSNGGHIILVTAENRDGRIGSDTVTITVDAPIPKTVDSFSDDFEQDMSRWILTADDDEHWSIKDPTIMVPDSAPANRVTGTHDCDNVCMMVMVDMVDLTEMTTPTLGFDWYVGTGADIRSREGIIAYVSEDGGNSWNVLERFTADQFRDDGMWHHAEYGLADYSSSQFKLRFDAVSNTDSEYTELDNVSVYDAADIEPEFTAVPDDITTEATGVLTAVDIGVATADSGITVTNDAPASFPLGTTTITWTATDNTGKTATDTQTVTIQDTTKPVFASLPDDISFSSAEPRQVGFDIPEATDIFPVTVSCSHIDGSVFGFGTTEVTCTATDTSDNHTTVSFSITITRILLTITAPPDVITEATAINTPVDTGTATTNIVSQITSDAPESFPLGDTIVTWTATSPSGQTATATQIITVQDTTKPVFEGTYNDISLESDGPVSFDVPIATDIFAVTVSCSPSSGDPFPAGTTTVTCTATDTSNNSDTTSFDVIVTRPISASHPIRAPADIIHEATDVLTVLDIGTPTIHPGVTTANDAPESFPLGDTIVTWTATNGTGYRFTDTQTVTVRDTTRPVFDGRYIDLTFEAPAPPRIPLYDPTATDIFDVTVSCDSPSDDVFPFGTTTVTCTATDTSGNSASLSFDVTIVKLPADEIHPEITAPADVTAEATGILSIIDIGIATATDDLYPKPRVTNDAPNSFPLGTTTVTWTATDGAGNRASDTQTITVRDTTRPVFTTNPGIINIMSSVPIPLSYDLPQATDIFPVTVSCNPPPGEGLLEVGSVIPVSCKATDTSNNTASLQLSVGILPPSDLPMIKYGIQNFEIETGETATLHLNTKFTHDGPLTYTVTLDNPQIASVEITGQTAVMTGLAQGTTRATACAGNDQHPLLCQTFEIRVTPAP